MDWTLFTLNQLHKHVFQFLVSIFFHRSLADVDKIMGWAKLQASEFVPTVQCLMFDSTLDNSSVQLMEVDSNLLQALQEGDRWGRAPWGPSH